MKAGAQRSGIGVPTTRFLSLSGLKPFCYCASPVVDKRCFANAALPSCRRCITIVRRGRLDIHQILRGDLAPPSHLVFLETSGVSRLPPGPPHRPSARRVIVPVSPDYTHTSSSQIGVRWIVLLHIMTQSHPLCKPLFRGNLAKSRYLLVHIDRTGPEAHPVSLVATGKTQ
jgi:hypothetical protein